MAKKVSRFSSTIDNQTNLQNITDRPETLSPEDISAGVQNRMDGKDIVYGNESNNFGLVSQQLANQQTGMQSQLANQSAQLQAQLANQATDIQGAGHRLASAGQLGQLSNLGFGMGQTVNQNLATQGAMQQALQQAVFDASGQKYGEYTGHPAAGLGYLTQALNATPLSTPQTNTLTKQPGLFDYLTLAASGYTGG